MGQSRDAKTAPKMRDLPTQAKPGDLILRAAFFLREPSQFHQAPLSPCRKEAKTGESCLSLALLDYAPGGFEPEVLQSTAVVFSGRFNFSRHLSLDICQGVAA